MTRTSQQNYSAYFDIGSGLREAVRPEAGEVDLEIKQEALRIEVWTRLRQWKALAC